MSSLNADRTERMQGALLPDALKHDNLKQVFVSKKVEIREFDLDPSVSLLKNLEIRVKKLESRESEQLEVRVKKLESRESEQLDVFLFKKSSSIFNKDLEVLAIHNPSMTGHDLCLLCAEQTTFKTSCCDHALCPDCIDDCTATCFNCREPLAFIFGDDTKYDNPNLGELQPSLSISYFAKNALYPEYSFLDFLGISYPVFRFKKATLLPISLDSSKFRRDLMFLDSNQLGRVYFATRGRCSAPIGTNVVAPAGQTSMN